MLFWPADGLLLVVHVISVAFALLTTHATSPTLTLAPEKSFPLMVITVPPEKTPLLGEIEVILGGDRKVNALPKLAACPSGLVTLRPDEPELLPEVLPVVQVILVPPVTCTPVHATPPTSTVAPERKPVPVTVRTVPPLLIPEVGETD